MFANKRSNWSNKSSSKPKRSWNNLNNRSRKSGRRWRNNRSLKDKRMRKRSLLRRLSNRSLSSTWSKFRSPIKPLSSSWNFSNHCSSKRKMTRKTNSSPFQSWLSKLWDWRRMRVRTCSNKMPFSLKVGNSKQPNSATSLPKTWSRSMSKLTRRDHELKLQRFHKTITLIWISNCATLSTRTTFRLNS